MSFSSRLTNNAILGVLALLIAPVGICAVKPVRTDTITPVRNASFNKGGKSRVRQQGGNPRKVGKLLVFDGSMDGKLQVDPQIAVGNG